MSRHRRQQRKRMRRGTWPAFHRAWIRAWMLRSLEGIQPPEPFDPNAYLFRQPTMDLEAAAEAVRNMNAAQAEYGKAAREQLASAVLGITMCPPEQVEEFFGGPLPEYPRGPDYSNHPAVATADTLFSIFGFRRVEAES